MTTIRGRDVRTEKHATGCCRRGLLHLRHNKMSRLEENATGLVTKSIIVNHQSRMQEALHWKGFVEIFIFWREKDAD